MCFPIAAFMPRSCNFSLMFHSIQHFRYISHAFTLSCVALSRGHWQWSWFSGNCFFPDGNSLGYRSRRMSRAKRIDRIPTVVFYNITTNNATDYILAVRRDILCLSQKVLRQSTYKNYPSQIGLF